MSRGQGPLERDTCRDVVLPMLAQSGWVDGDNVVQQYPVIGAARTRKRLGHDLGDGFVDYVLEARPGVPTAVVEAKRAYRSASDGLQQAIRYARQLDVPLAYATNGFDIVERDMTTGRERRVQDFETPAELWARYRASRGLDDAQAEVLAQPFSRQRRTASGEIVQPRYYQRTAVHRVLKAIASGQRRVLLLMATGTGKTLTAMQLVAKLRSYAGEVNPGRNYRVLYLADLDKLVDQPMRKDFKPAFGEEPVVRVRRGVGTSREIYFACYQALVGGRADDTDVLDVYPPDFFDLVIVDECHRGSAATTSSWRRVIEHFSSAVQLGLTATPKADSDVDTYSYFGEPVFEYSLRQGIEDGFLAPYRVTRVMLSPDVEGWEPAPGAVDRFGRDIPPGVYATRDFERTVSLLARTELAAKHLSTILRRNPTSRAMVFCQDVEHAEQMRAALVAENPDLVRDDPEWVVRIVGTEPEKERLLDAFCDPEQVSPVVATTSKLLSTGVDVEDLRFVVLFRAVGSMVEFKQIIGRGTRLYPADGKYSFDIIDYVGATAHFQDPAFDGRPTSTTIETVDGDGTVIATTPGDPADADPSTGDPADGSGVASPEPPFCGGGEGDLDEDGPEVPGAVPRRRKLYVDEGDFGILGEARYVADRSTGELSLTEFGEFVAEEVRAVGDSPAVVLRRWAHADDREEIRAQLERHGVDLGEVMADPALALLDPVDVLIQIAFNIDAPTRAERVRRVRVTHHADLALKSDAARAVLEAMLQRYADHGVDDVTAEDVLEIPPISALGSPREIAAAFGGARALHDDLDELQRWLYSA